MGVRLRWRFRVAPGVHLNVSKSGLSMSLGGAPATLNIGRRGLKGTISAPGTGLSYSKDIPFVPTSEAPPPQEAQAPKVSPSSAPPASISVGPIERRPWSPVPTLLTFGILVLLAFGLWQLLGRGPTPETSTADAAAEIAPAAMLQPFDAPLPRPRPVRH